LVFSGTAEGWDALLLCAYLAAHDAVNGYGAQMLLAMLKLWPMHWGQGEREIAREREQKGCKCSTCLTEQNCETI